ncbi:MAG TPA: [FeFe] hydrogenase H-cluster radical SAM maturase HydE [Bacteroidales bacterium]|nr:[FeFe] hydrogenase H-cluster radical SAM maturase HydE [Bacteroidales bacterium]
MKTEVELTRKQIIHLLSLTERDEQQALFDKAYATKVDLLGKRVNLRGLIEFSNVCQKNCLYCGIRNGNTLVHRYTMKDEEILQAVSIAQENGLTGVVLQSGERTDAAFVKQVVRLIQKIKNATEKSFRMTLSTGEQSLETYQKWFDAGAQRYLLRMETTNEALYNSIHPNDGSHSFKNRLNCLEIIQQVGYQTGTGVMIGLPGQSVEHLADDLLFIQQKGIDMVGMGPYIEHEQTPMYQKREIRISLMERFELALRMIAVLRLLMPTINIASTTALQSIHPFGRELGLSAGANVLMPNISPIQYRKNYLLYDNKPSLEVDANENLENLLLRIKKMGEQVVYHDYGDSNYFINRQLNH